MRHLARGGLTWKTLDVSLRELPSQLDGLRITQLSDIHVSRITPDWWIRRAVDLANSSQPDAIVMTGDYVGWRSSDIARVGPLLSGLRAPRKIAVLGNHDYFCGPEAVSTALRKLGFEVLRNSVTDIEFNGATLAVVGIDDPITKHHDIASSFRQASGRPSIALCHCPEPAEKIIEHGASLVMSGHTHGSQIWIPGLTSRIYRRTKRKYLSGLYKVGQGKVYVTPGIGYSGIRMRLGDVARAEVATLTLKTQSA